MKTKFTCSVIALIVIGLAVNAQNSWQITGNSNITTNNFIGTTNKTALKLRTNNIVRMTVNPSGSIGIGTASPKAKLDVAGSITAYSSYFTRKDGAPGISIGRSGANYGSVGYGLTFTDTTDRYRYNISDFSSMLSFRAGGFDFNTAPIGTAGNVISYTTAMAILQNGNVGIGTLTPANKFYVSAAPSNLIPVAYIENTSGTASSEGLYIKAGSNAIGGSALIGFFRPDGLQIGSVGQISTNGVIYLTTSDKRLKNIIGTSQKGLFDLMKIKIYDYTFKSDPNKNVQTGFMAQELYEIFPQAVSKPRDNNEPAEKNPWMVDYGRVTPLIIKAVQELNESQNLKFKSQDEEIAKLKKEIAELKALLISQNKENALETKQIASNQ